MSATPTVDLRVTNHGSIIGITAISDAGLEWLGVNVEGGTAGAVFCDHRCGLDIMEGATREGLIVQDAETGRLAAGGR